MRTSKAARLEEYKSLLMKSINGRFHCWKDVKRYIKLRQEFESSYFGLNKSKSLEKA